MRKYKNYYIDGVTFKSEEEIDAFLKEIAVRAFSLAVKMFAKKPDIEHSIYADGKAEVLVREFDLAWGEVEELERQALGELAECL